MSTYKPTYGQQKSPHRKRATFTPATSRVAKYGFSSTDDEDESSPAYNNNNTSYDFDDGGTSSTTTTALFPPTHSSSSSSVLNNNTTINKQQQRTTTTTRSNVVSQHQHNNGIDFSMNGGGGGNSFKASAAADAKPTQAKVKATGGVGGNTGAVHQRHHHQKQRSLVMRMFDTISYPFVYVFNLISRCLMWINVTLSTKVHSPVDMNHQNKGHVEKKSKVIGWVTLVSVLVLVLVYVLFYKSSFPINMTNHHQTGVDEQAVIQILHKYIKEHESKMENKFDNKLGIIKTELISTTMTESEKLKLEQKKENQLINTLVDTMREELTELIQTRSSNDPKELLEIYKAQLDSHVNRIMGDLTKHGKTEKEEIHTLITSAVNKLQEAMKQSQGDIGKSGQDQLQKLLLAFEENANSRLNIIVQSLDHQQTTEREKLLLISKKATEQIQSFREIMEKNPDFISISKGLTALEQTQLLIDDALEKYSSDKTGRADFALWVSGGSIAYDLEHYPITQTYQNDDVSWLDIATAWLRPVPRLNPPETILEPIRNIGDCWAFPGNNGTIGIHLSAPIIVRSVSIEHPNSKITYHSESSPQEFEILGLKNSTDTGVSLATFKYDIHKNRHLQTFNFDNEQVYSDVVIKILSNYGYKYTCLYRIRVHGLLSGDYNDPRLTF
ncbi:SUN domain-containing protein 1 [Cavenderia fasciculata]|uniref:SUN domain-containing protein 1 n=1 Tax=Cavenderia fasciculata TaxID=261658 RepID=F4PQB4_CACFS|nr:SUN domain-containing protein 1 [Cavenderia fasciculata]EGG22577.1 SUN domain-containing protein 1 [Cavenderia fasciculata]|eukprot:XP_004360428.1 SUN domain-containing protein 1 [Cavenderia fasciculata]